MNVLFVDTLRCDASHSTSPTMWVARSFSRSRIIQEPRGNGSISRSRKGRAKYSRSNLINASYSNLNIIRAMGVPLAFLRGRA